MGKPSRRTRLNLAYGAYAFLGLVALWTSLITWGGGEGAAAGAVFFVIFPLGLPILAAIPLALILSIVLWREWPLPVLAMLTIGLGCVVYLVEIMVVEDRVIYTLIPFYALTALGPAAYWFFKRRNRFPKPS
jgi:hypothetical protein